MTPRRLGLLFGLAALVACAAMGPRLVYAADKKDYLEHPGTSPVALTGGDTPSTYSVVCATQTGTALRPAVTDRSRRRIRFQNRSAAVIFIGSSTVAASNLWAVGESTNAATIPYYDTNASGAYFCNTVAGSTVQSTMTVIEETQSVP